MASRGSTETAALRANVEDQLERLLQQLQVRHSSVSLRRERHAARLFSRPSAPSVLEMFMGVVGNPGGGAWPLAPQRAPRRASEAWAVRLDHNEYVDCGERRGSSHTTHTPLVARNSESSVKKGRAMLLELEERGLTAAPKPATLHCRHPSHRAEPRRNSHRPSCAHVRPHTTCTCLPQGLVCTITAGPRRYAGGAGRRRIRRNAQRHGGCGRACILGIVDCALLLTLLGRWWHWWYWW